MLGAAAGSAGGALVGGVLGAYIGGNRCTVEGNPDSCYLILGTAVGLGIGMTVGAPVGAHLMNRRQGNLTAGLLASTGIGLAGLAALLAADRNVHGSGRTATLQGILLVVPVVQILGAGLIEARTGSAR